MASRSTKKHRQLDAGPTFDSMAKASAEHGEDRDCAVKALAIACGVPYSIALEALYDAGRKPRKGTPFPKTKQAANALGFSVTEIKRPATAKTFITLPKAMRQAGLNKGAYFIRTTAHIAAFVDGKIHDWTVGKRKPILSIWLVKPLAPHTTSSYHPNNMPKEAPAVRQEPKVDKPNYPKFQAPSDILGKPVGVRACKSRPYLAGMLIAQHGLDKGVTPAMVEELDKLYGKANPAESEFCLKNAWHAARGFWAVKWNGEGL